MGRRSVNCRPWMRLMGTVSSLRCPKCGSQPASPTIFRCAGCGCILEVKVEIGHLTLADLQAISHSRDHSIWRWFAFFPVENRASIVSLGEGGTPLTHAGRLGAQLGLSRLFLKNDTILPTGSLKDRSNSVGISKAQGTRLHHGNGHVNRECRCVRCSVRCGGGDEKRRSGAGGNGASKDRSSSRLRRYGGRYRR